MLKEYSRAEECIFSYWVSNVWYTLKSCLICFLIITTSLCGSSCLCFIWSGRICDSNLGMTSESILHRYVSLLEQKLGWIFFFLRRILLFFRIDNCYFFGMVSSYDWKCGIIVLSRTLESFLFYLYSLPLSFPISRSDTQGNISKSQPVCDICSFVFPASPFVYSSYSPRKFGNFCFVFPNHLDRIIWRWMLSSRKRSC